MINKIFNDYSNQLEVKLPIEYFVAHLSKYVDNKQVLEGIWNKIDIDGNDQTMVNANSLDLILKAFIFLIKIIIMRLVDFIN